MRAYLPEYEMRVPESLREALMLLERDPEVWRPFAGGTDLMVLLEAGKLAHRKFLSIWHLSELKGIEETAEYVTLGALTTYTQVQASSMMQREFPALCRAASETGGLAIQNRGTLGGNIANASPAADSSPALLVYEAQLELVSAAETRWIPYRDLHLGYKQLHMRSDELISRIRLPRPAPDCRHYYRKVGTRKAQAISKVCFAGLAQMDGDRIKDIRLACGSVAPTVIRPVRAESLLKDHVLDGAAISAARAEFSREILPIDDIRSTASYRLRVAQNLLEDFLSQLMS